MRLRPLSTPPLSLESAAAVLAISVRSSTFRQWHTVFLHIFLVIFKFSPCDTEPRF